MISYDFSISSYCNAACPSCKRYKDFCKTNYVDPKNLDPSLVQKHMKYDVFEKSIIDNYDYFVCRDVIFEGELGDSMMNPELFKFINFGSKVFRVLLIVTNGGTRNHSFYNKVGNQYKNVEIKFSIDGLEPDTNGIYRRRVDTQKALSNMICFSKTKYGSRNTYWQYIIFEHNYFEIPDVLELAAEHNITVFLKINKRPRFLLQDNKIKIVEKYYEKYKFNKSFLEL